VETEFVAKPEPEDAPWAKALDEDVPAPTVNLRKDSDGEAKEQE
jgi:hypothetical protein